MPTFTQRTSRLIIKNKRGELLQVTPETVASQVIYPEGTTSTVADYLGNVPTFSDMASVTSDGLMSSTDKIKLNGIATGANAYVHPTDAGNKHIPSGGSSGQFLKWSSDGTAVWADDNNTTYAAATTDTLGLVKIASNANITNTNGALSITKANVTTALGYTPPTSDTNTTYDAGTASLLTTGTDTSNRVWQAKIIADYVSGKIDSKIAENDAMIYKGTISSASALPATHNAGWTYKASNAFTFAQGTTYQQAVEVGDIIICNADGTSTNNAHWDIIQKNIEGAVTGPANSTDLHIAVFSGTNGKIIKDSGYTIGTSVPANAIFTDTTYDAGTASDLTTGTNTTNKIWQPKIIADYVKGSIPNVSITTSGSGTLVSSVSVDTTDKHKLIVSKSEAPLHVKVTSTVPTTANSTDVSNGSVIIYLES